MNLLKRKCNYDLQYWYNHLIWIIKISNLKLHILSMSRHYCGFYGTEDWLNHCGDWCKQEKPLQHLFQTYLCNFAVKWKFVEVALSVKKVCAAILISCNQISSKKYKLRHYKVNIIINPSLNISILKRYCYFFIYLV